MNDNNIAKEQGKRIASGAERPKKSDKSYEGKKKELAKMHGHGEHSKASFTPKSKKEERLFKKHFQSKIG